MKFWKWILCTRSDEGMVQAMNIITINIVIKNGYVKVHLSTGQFVQSANVQKLIVIRQELEVTKEMHMGFY